MNKYRLFPTMPDSKLLEVLFAKVNLTAEQTAAFVHYATLLATGMRSLPRTVRDHAHAVMRAAGVSLAPQRPKKAKASVFAGLDCYSTDRTKGTEYADRVLSTRPSRPPNRPKRAA